MPPEIVPLPELPPAFSIEALDSTGPLGTGRSCRDSENGEIVVCGRRDDQRFRLQPLPPRMAIPLPDPDIPFGMDVGRNSRAGLVIDQVEFPGGYISRRAMISFRTRF